MRGRGARGFGMRLNGVRRLQWLIAAAGPAVVAAPTFALVGPLAMVGTGGSGAPAFVQDEATPSDEASREPNLGLSLDAAVKVEVERSGGVPLADGSSCPTASLQVSYELPGDGWSSGAYIDPLGPEPDAGTTEVNGVVLCDGSRYAFIGFEASLVDGEWSIGVVPDPAGGFESEEDEEKANDPDTHPAPIPIDPTKPIVGLLDSAAIEGYARYEGQSTCDPTAKPGTLALRNLLLARYPSTGSSGISRACDIGGRSEHKEGRAFDWRANVTNATQKAAVDDFVAALFATDSYGHQHALARRMGVMYVIWNRQMWSAYSAGAGWRPYNGSSPHTDHVHISLSWAGARAQTSFWSGTVVPGLPALGRDTGSGGSRRQPATGTSTSRTRRGSAEQVAAPTMTEERWRRRRDASTTATPTWDRDDRDRVFDHERDWDNDRDRAWDRERDRAWDRDRARTNEGDWDNDRRPSPTSTSTTVPRSTTTTTSTTVPRSTTTSTTAVIPTTTMTSTTSTTLAGTDSEANGETLP